MSPKREDGALGPERRFIGEKRNGLEEGLPGRCRGGPQHTCAVGELLHSPVDA
jgi:hypothetical protein